MTTSRHATASVDLVASREETIFIQMKSGTEAPPDNPCLPRRDTRGCKLGVRCAVSST
ncbi:hypothetical protein HanRHA438_Chr00c17g0850961 [Helianthus annuus]|nr:hypothetical protein HanRHA438_Chr00c17g0850961 [Helianthus annuus]